MTRRFAIVAGWLTSVCLTAAVARAQDSLDDGLAAAAPASGIASSEINGYASERFAYQNVAPKAVVPTRDLPTLSEVAELNLQLKVNLGARTAFAYADLSAVYQGGWMFYASDGQGGRARVPEHDVSSLHPYLVPSELYLSVSPRPWLNVVAGKKRITWGAGVAFNPTDLVNPPKDPTDPNYQRAGNWVVRVEAPFEKITLSALFAPQALYTQGGIPYALVRYPGYPPESGADPRDGALHYLVAGRLYALVGNADVNLMYYFSDHYQDGFHDKSRLGGSFSRYFLTDYELHVEALLSRGSARLFPRHECAIDLTSCSGNAPLTPSKLDDGRFFPRVVLGTRRMFSDESQLSVEYYYQGDGYSAGEMQDFLAVMTQSGGATSGLTSAASTSNALPQRYAFDPLRRHYLIVSFSKPRIRDDWTVGAVLIAGLGDLSGLVAPSISWSARAWLTLAAYGYVPFGGPGPGTVRAADGRWSEYSLAPYDARVLFEARAYY